MKCMHATIKNKAMIFNSQHFIHPIADFAAAIPHTVPIASLYIVESLTSVLSPNVAWIKSPCIHSHFSRSKSLHSVYPSSNGPRYCNIVGVSWWQGVVGGISLSVQEL